MQACTFFLTSFARGRAAGGVGSLPASEPLAESSPPSREDLLELDAGGWGRL